MSYDFNIKHNMHNFECKLNAVINMENSLINKLGRNWRHPLDRKIESYPVWSNNQTLKLMYKIF